MKRTGLILATVAALTVIGCTNMTPREQGTVSGAAIGAPAGAGEARRGAAAGAGIAAIAGGSGWTGAAIGGILGGTIGNIKGKQQ